jgi:N-acetylmuramoyl-L-alanine amidase CwlA
MTYEFIKKVITKNNPNMPIIEMRAHVVHWTANTNNGANAMAHFNYFNNNDVDASANYFIDDKTIVETIPSGMVAWHAGGSRYTDYAQSKFAYEDMVKPNYYTIGYELCVNSDGDFEMTCQNAIDFIAKKVIETGCQEIIRHHDVTGKDCPKMFTFYTEGGEQAWLDFKNKIFTKVAELTKAQIDYEKQVIRVKVDGVQVVAVTGYTKAFKYAQQYIGKKVILQCKTDGYVWDLGVIEDPNKPIIEEPKIETPVEVPIEIPKVEPVKEYPKGIEIMGLPILTVYQMVKYVENATSTYKLNCTLLKLAELFLQEGLEEGVRGDIAFCQSVLETAFFRYGNQVLPAQNNYAGIGATNDSGVGKGAWFDNPQLGIRAQIQHLKAYASTEPLKNECLDPRFKYVKRGRAPYWEWLGKEENPSNIDRPENDRQGWAVPGPDYGHKIIAIYEKIKLLPESEPIPVEVPKEEPKIEIPVEAPKIEEPKVEIPIETPKVETPVDEPKTEINNEEINLTEEQKNILVSLIMRLFQFFLNLFKKK